MTETRAASQFKPVVEATKTMFGRVNGYTAKLLGWEGRGETKDGAKNDLAIAIERAMGHDIHGRTPIVITHKGHAVFIWFDPVYGWLSKTLDPQDLALNNHEHCVYGSCGYEFDRDRVVRSAKCHLARISWNPGDDIPEIVPKDDIPDFMSWMEFQNRYHHAKTHLKLSDPECHDYAGRNPAKTQHWLAEENSSKG
ncbi:MAG: hypothetical protein ACKO0Z_24900 [Betaproteobacteria bacterium]